jgi:hypothetical protein
MRVLCKELGFVLIPIVAHLFPGQVFQYAVNGKEIPSTMQAMAKHLIYSVDDQLEYTKSKINSKCHITNAFPTVAWDGKVLHCCNMQKPTVGHSTFMNTPLQEFIDMRNGSPFCSSCMDHGVHRFFDVNVSLEEVDGKRTIIRL